MQDDSGKRFDASEDTFVAEPMQLLAHLRLRQQTLNTENQQIVHDKDIDELLNEVRQFRCLWDSFRETQEEKNEAWK